MKNCQEAENSRISGDASFAGICWEVFYKVWFSVISRKFLTFKKKSGLKCRKYPQNARVTHYLDLWLYGTRSENSLVWSIRQPKFIEFPYWSKTGTEYHDGEHPCKASRLRVNQNSDMSFVSVFSLLLLWWPHIFFSLLDFCFHANRTGGWWAGGGLKLFLP